MAKLDPHFKNLKDTIHQILEDIRKSNHSVLKKSPFELHFGRKPNTVWSQARNKVVQSDTSAQGLERNLLTPDQIASNDYSRDRAKVVPRGSSSPTIPTRFKPLFSLDGNVADREPYKALADLARAANKWSQFRRNLPPDAGKLVLKELKTRHSDLAHSLKSGLNSNTLHFSVIASPPGTQVNSRRAPIVQPTRLSRTSKLKNLLLSDPGRVKVFRKIIDRQSGKPLYKLTKFKIVRVTDHTYITDKGKVYRKNHICLKPNYRPAILVAPNTIGDRAQDTSSTSRGAAKRPVTRSQPVLLEQRPINHSLSTPIVDLTVDSSSESSIGSNNDRQVTRNSVTTGKRQRFQCDSPPVRFAHHSASTSTPHSSTHATHSRNVVSTQQPVGSFISPQPGTLHRAVSSSYTRPMELPEVSTSSPDITVSSPEKEVSKDSNPPSPSASSHMPSSYPSLSVPAQPVVDDAESVGTSHRSQKPTQFFGNPLRHSVKFVEEDRILPSTTTLASPLIPVTEEQIMASNTPTVSIFSPRKQLIRDRFQPQSSTQTSSSFPHRKETTGTD